MVYANECLKELKGRQSSSLGLRPVLRKSQDYEDPESKDILTKAKRIAMKKEAGKFYSRYPGQTWKNIFSIGDMHYERDALQEVTFTRVSPPREDIRTKVIVVPTKPTLKELTLRLRFGEILLPAYVHHDGDIDLDLPALPDPLQAIASALDIPQLGSLQFPRFAWGAGPDPTEEEIRTALEELSTTVQEEMLWRLCNRKGIAPCDIVRLVSS